MPPIDIAEEIRFELHGPRLEPDDVSDSISLPVPSCFELSAPARRLFARETAAAIKHYFQPAASDAGCAA